MAWDAYVPAWSIGGFVLICLIFWRLQGEEKGSRWQSSLKYEQAVSVMMVSLGDFGFQSPPFFSRRGRSVRFCGPPSYLVHRLWFSTTTTRSSTSLFSLPRTWPEAQPYVGMGQLEKALAEFTRALKLDPQAENAAAYLEQTKLKVGFGVPSACGCFAAHDEAGCPEGVG